MAHSQTSLCHTYGEAVNGAPMHYFYFLQRCVIAGLIITSTPISHAQERLSGTWVLSGQYYASGSALPPTAELNVNNTRLTIVGESSGVIIVDEPMRFGDNGQIQISCRGTVRSHFLISRVAGLIVLHETNVIETAGGECRQMAGTSTNVGDGSKIIEVAGDTMRIINCLADADRPTKAIDMAIYTYRRVQPTKPH